jgi:hypothetical protein
MTTEIVLPHKEGSRAGFDGCAFVFVLPGQRPPEGEPVGLDVAQFAFDMQAAINSANVVPWLPAWRAKRKAQGAR